MFRKSKYEEETQISDGECEHEEFSVTNESSKCAYVKKDENPPPNNIIDKENNDTNHSQSDFISKSINNVVSDLKTSNPSVVVKRTFDKTTSKTMFDHLANISVDEPVATSDTQEAINNQKISNINDKGTIHELLESTKNCDNVVKEVNPPTTEYQHSMDYCVNNEDVDDSGVVIVGDDNDDCDEMATKIRKTETITGTTVINKNNRINYINTDTIENVHEEPFNASTFVLPRINNKREDKMMVSSNIFKCNPDIFDSQPTSPTITSSIGTLPHTYPSHTTSTTNTANTTKNTKSPTKHSNILDDIRIINTEKEKPLYHVVNDDDYEYDIEENDLFNNNQDSNIPPSPQKPSDKSSPPYNNDSNKQPPLTTLDMLTLNVAKFMTPEITDDDNTKSILPIIKSVIQIIVDFLIKQQQQEQPSHCPNKNNIMNGLCGMAGINSNLHTHNQITTDSLDMEITSVKYVCVEVFSRLIFSQYKQEILAVFKQGHTSSAINLL